MANGFKDTFESGVKLAGEIESGNVNPLTVLEFGVNLIGNVGDVTGPRTFCFPAGTMVHTADGQRPIETIRAGDQVWSCDRFTGEWELKGVKETFSRLYEDELVRVKLSTGETLSATVGHPVYVQYGEALSQRPVGEHHLEILLEERSRRGKLQLVNASSRYADSWGTATQTLPGRWVDAQDLKPGDILYTLAGEEVTVLDIEFEFACEPVYNFHVEDFHNYCIGEYGTLVNNTCQDHHAIPHNNSRYKHHNHPLVKKAGVNLKTYKNNIKSVDNHAGRHSNKYHSAIQNRMNKAFASLGANATEAAAKQALDNIIKGIWRDIKSGKLKLYDHKDVFLK